MKRSGNADVEVQHFLARAELLVERDRGVVAVVRLDVDDPRTALSRDLAETLDEGGRDSASAMWLGDGEVVDVELTPSALELVELVGDEPADDLLGHARDESNHVLLLEEGTKIRI